MKKKSEYIYIIIAILSIIALIFSGVILIQKTTENDTINNICSILNSQSQCLKVQQSSYAKIFGIDNPWFGIIGFTILIILSFLNYSKENFFRRRIIIAAGILSGTMAIYFLYLQAFLIRAYCVFCIFVDTISIILLILSFYITYKEYH